mgnify:FL=1
MASDMMANKTRELLAQIGVIHPCTVLSFPFIGEDNFTISMKVEHDQQRALAMKMGEGIQQYMSLFPEYRFILIGNMSPVNIRIFPYLHHRHPVNYLYHHMATSTSCPHGPKVRHSSFLTT